jgi:hypothetical protein
MSITSLKKNKNVLFLDIIHHPVLLCRRHKIVDLINLKKKKNMFLFLKRNLLLQIPVAHMLEIHHKRKSSELHASVL